jgi:hypothetical protein
MIGQRYALCKLICELAGAAMRHSIRHAYRQTLPLLALYPLLLPDARHACGEAVWAARALTRGSNLCHGTGGNGYAFLVLYQRTDDITWLQRARAFAMHGIAQTEADEAAHGQLRYSLWTGDPGFAIYLWDCLRGKAAFPPLDVFYGDAG